MIGYRTFIVAGLYVVLVLVSRFGFDYDPGVVADIAIGAAMALMRTITRTPMRKKR